MYIYDQTLICTLFKTFCNLNYKRCRELHETNLYFPWMGFQPSKVLLCAGSKIKKKESKHYKLINLKKSTPLPSNITQNS